MIAATTIAQAHHGMPEAGPNNCDVTSEAVVTNWSISGRRY